MNRQELAARYVSALASAASGKKDRPILATDLSLYLGQIQPWFDEAMIFWAAYVSHEVARGRLSPPFRRNVIRHVPLRAPTFGDIAQAQEYWLETKVGMHWLLSPGPYNLVTFGTLDIEALKALTYCVIPQVVLVETPGVYDGDFQTIVSSGRRGSLASRAAHIESLIDRAVERDADPASQSVFPLYYQADTFSAKRQTYHYFRNVIGRFLWRLQAGICPPCGLGVQYQFDEMQVDHIIPVAQGGNNSLLNTEVKCREHNNRKRHRLSETRDHLVVVRKIARLHGITNAPMQRLFSMEATDLAFPVAFRFAFG